MLNSEEKLEGLTVFDANHEDFKNYIASYDLNLNKIPSKRSPFTWWNGKVGNNCIFKRLDRFLANQDM